MKLYDPSVTGSLIITGSIGIGTDPVSGQKLTVAGNMSASGDLIIGNLSGNYISASNGNMEISDELRVSRIVATGSSQVSEIHDNLNIFGTVNTSLHIEDLSSDAGYQNIELDDYNSTYPGEIRRYGSGTGLNGSEESLNFFTNNSRHLMISGSSTTAVGIGISLSADEPNPIPKTLTVRGDISGSGNLFIFGSGGESVFGGDDGSGGGMGDNQKITVGVSADQSASIHLKSANKDWEILTSKLGTYNNALLFRLNGSDTHIFDQNGRLGVNTVTPSKELTVNGDISGSSRIYAGKALIGSATNKWSDGFHGNDEFIALVPDDFQIPDSSAAVTRGYAPYGADPGKTRTANTFGNFLCYKIIPKGFSATGVQLYGSGLPTNSMAVYSSSIETDSFNTIDSSLNPVSNNTLSSAIVGDGISYIVILVNPDTSTDEIHGGKVYIQRT